MHNFSLVKLSTAHRAVFVELTDRAEADPGYESCCSRAIASRSPRP